jgi:hypothetical protein
MKNKRKTTIEFIEKAKIIHGDRYDYSLVNYETSKQKVKIICKKHGVFEQTPDSHINGKSNCPICVNNKKLTTEEFIKKAKLVHGDKYDYSSVKYVNDSNKINVICVKHGKFEVKAGNHLRGDNCSKCTNNRKLTTIEFIEKAKIIHGDRYDYSLVDYLKQTKKVKIICKKHGVFEQNPNNHLNNNGCPKCKESKGERTIREYLEINKINFNPQHRFDKCKYKLKLPFDFYLPELNICIEFNGRQHYEPIELWGGFKSLKEIQKRDKIKMEYCKNNNIPLIIIKYSDKVINKLDRLINPKPKRPKF